MMPPKFVPELQNVLRLLCCSQLEYLLKLVLNRAIMESGISDDLVEEVMFTFA